MSFEIVFTQAAEEDLKKLSPFDRNTILDAVERHLSHQPDMESRSRIKQLTQPAISGYRLRVGDFRVYYDIESKNRRL